MHGAGCGWHRLAPRVQLSCSLQGALSMQKLQGGGNELARHDSYGATAGYVREAGVGKGARALMRCSSSIA